MSGHGTGRAAPFSRGLGVQTQAGLPRDKIVAAHGNFDSATCISTGRPVPIEEVRDAIMGEDCEGWKRLRDRHGGLVRPNSDAACSQASSALQTDRPDARR